MICIIDCGTTSLDELKQSVSLHGHESEVIKIDELKGFDSRYSGIVISGAAILLTETDPKPYLEKFSFITQIKVPVLGICLGHQIIGLLHGSVIGKGEYIDKMEKIKIIDRDALFDGVTDNMFREQHSEYITVPKGFKHLARSKSCENEAMMHENLYGVQFHPELSGEQGKKVFGNFLRLC
jgi:GMP synthase (glutamine-hydrolysing)